MDFPGIDSPLVGLASGDFYALYLEQAIEDQAKTLLGADLVLGAQEKFSPEEDAWFKELGGEQSREVSLTTMIYFPRTESSRLVQLRALSGGFPFYGRLETEPVAAPASACPSR